MKKEKKRKKNGTNFEYETAEGGAARASGEPKEDRVLTRVPLRLYEVVEQLHTVHLINGNIPSACSWGQQHHWLRSSIGHK